MFIDRLKEIEYQFKKNLTWTPSDQQFVAAVASILNSLLKHETALVDAELPVTFAGCTLNWYHGEPGDTLVKVTKGAVVLDLDVTQKFAPDLSWELHNLVVDLLTTINGSSEELDLGASYNNDYTLILSDAETMTDLINGGM